MAAEPGSERADGDMSKDSVKGDKKKNKKEKKKAKEEDTEMEGQEQPSDATVVSLTAERDVVEGKQSTKSKKSKRKPSDAGEASPNDQALTGQDKKRKKEHPVALEESGQKHLSPDTAVQNLATRFDEAEGEQSGKSKKSKSKRSDAGEGQQQTLDATVENLVAKSDEVEGKQSSKSDKSKSKRGEASAGDQAVTTKDKKRKKEHPVGLEKSSQPKNTSEGESEKGNEGNKSSLKSNENASAGGEVADVDGKNDKKKKSKEGTAQEGIKEKDKAARPMSKDKRVSFADSTKVFETQGGGDEGTEGGKNNNKKKAAQSKNKGKRVSFADSTEVFETEGVDGEGTEGGKKKGKKAAQSMNKGKRVSFADSAEVFETEGGDDEEGGSGDESEVVHGQRFTQEEDDTLMEAIMDFIEMKQLGEKGLEMFRTPRKHKELRHCWDVIGKSLPHRPHNAIYRRARILLSRSDKRGWTKKEKDYIRSYVHENGTQWKKLAHKLGKCDIHVKDTWRRIKSDKLNKGYWTQDEHQKLFDLVNLDLRMKAHQIKNPDNRKLRDNISWEAISDKLSTRNHKNCCLKWYDTLASPLVRKGVWADLDDYLLVEALQKDDAICIEDVDWDSLLDHRSGQVCRQRWNQMVRGLGGHREKPFIEQVDVLSQRYCSEMIEYRKGSEETPARDASSDKKKKSKESKEPGVASAEVEKEKKKKKKKSKEIEEPGAADAEVEKEKKKSKESEEPRAANAEVEKEKKKSKESEEPGAANAEVEKEKKKSKENEEPGAANAEVEKEKKKKKKKSKESEEPGAANAEVEKEKKKKMMKSKESEEPGVTNAEVEKEKTNKKKKSKESEGPGVANAEVKKEKRKSKESGEPGAGDEVEKEKRKKKPDTQDDEVVAMEAESGKQYKKKKLKQADQ